MGRRAKEPDLTAPLPDPDKPRGLTAEASAWWDGVVRQRSGLLGPTDAYMMVVITKFMKLGEQYAGRLDVEGAVRGSRADANVHVEEAILKNYSTCVHNVVRLAAEMGLTPRSRKSVPPAVSDRKKKSAPKTSLDALKPTHFTPTLPGGRNGTHVDR